VAADVAVSAVLESLVSGLCTRIPAKSVVEQHVLKPPSKKHASPSRQPVAVIEQVSGA
jgi:hypothetical protein